MQSKLTLRLEDELIKKAKRVARKRGKSLSKIVADYFAFISAEETDDEYQLPKNTKSLIGSLSEKQISESDYKRYLEEKYL